MSTATAAPATPSPSGSHADGTPSPPDDTGPRAAALWRRAWPYLVVALGVAALMLLAGRPRDTGLPLDPTSAGPLGTRAAVDVLRALGADVTLTPEPPASSADTALLLVDAYDQAARADLLSWVEAGGVLVVADPFSELVDEPVNSTQLLFTNPGIARDCDLPALAEVDRVTSPGGSVFSAPEGSTACFPRNDAFWLLATPRGEGTVVALGGAQGFTNVELGEADNAQLLVSLLAPDPASARIAVLETPPPGSGEQTLVDLVPDGAAGVGLQLLLAFGVVVAWRARRFGAPVTEAAPVEVPGSELVVARGNLLQTTSAAPHAAGMLREEARRWLAAALGLPARADAEQVADTAAARTGVRREEVLELLRPSGAVDEAALVRVAQQLEAARQGALTAPPPPETGGPRT